jgi:hypothetical protein
MSSTLFSKRHDPHFGRNRKARPKTFRTEEAAKKWAESQKCQKYEIVPAAKKGKFKVKC